MVFKKLHNSAEELNYDEYYEKDPFYIGKVNVHGCKISLKRSRKLIWRKRDRIEDVNI